MRMRISRITAPICWHASCIKKLARFLQRLARYKNYFLMLFYSNQAIDTRREGCIIHYMDRGISPYP